jgi:biopolymer transport protein ExbB
MIACLRHAASALAALSLCATAPALAQSPPDTFAAARAAIATQDHARHATLAEDPEALEAALAAARERREAAELRRAALEVRQAGQRERLEARDRRRGERDADVEALAEVLEGRVGELRDDLGDGWLALEASALPERDAPLTPARLEAVADAFMTLTAESGRVVRETRPVAGADGRVEARPVVRLGALAAFTEGDWLRRDGPDLPPALAEHTPREAGERLAAFARGEGERAVIDPTLGELVEALARRPTLVERFHQGGAVGYVVVALGALGLAVALGQLGYLLVVGRRLGRQLRSLDRLDDGNPLGRVLGRFQALRHGLAPEALEARLDEALLAELPRLERGQPLVKLLAAVAPLLGLLGTVTGMIVTFQTITVFGTGDPQLMAGGISQALVTTVLGLVTAVPMLFAHTALASRSRRLAGILEGQASAVLAEHLEAQPGVATPHEPRHAPAYS